MNIRALKIWELRCKRALFTFAGLCLVSLIGYQAYAEDIWRPINQRQMLSFGTTSSISTTAFGSQTYRVRAVCSSSCYISFGVSGENPNASSATGIMLPANEPEVFLVSPNGKIAVTTGGVTGILSITELTR